MNNNQAKRLETLALETEANKKKLVKALRGTPKSISKLLPP
jgi:hypothetical protein